MKFFIVLLLLSVIQPSFAAIYKWTDKDGVIHFSENKPDEIVVEELFIKTYENVVIENNNENKDFKPGKKTNNQPITRPKKVIMYSAQWCGVCKQAKKYFKKENIRFTNYDIDKSKRARARYEKLGAKGVPVIFVGKRRMNGFSVDGFNQIYK